ncbi:hypothetical protein Tco_0637168 [Tanacetum coccineum]
MLADNVRGETFEEHDIYMNELLKSLKTADKDRLTEDPFVFVEKYVKRLVKSIGSNVDKPEFSFEVCPVLTMRSHILLRLHEQGIQACSG